MLKALLNYRFAHYLLAVLVLGFLGLAVPFHYSKAEITYFEFYPHNWTSHESQVWTSADAEFGDFVSSFYYEWDDSGVNYSFALNGYNSNDCTGDNVGGMNDVLGIFQVPDFFYGYTIFQGSASDWPSYTEINSVLISLQDDVPSVVGEYCLNSESSVLSESDQMFPITYTTLFSEQGSSSTTNSTSTNFIYGNVEIPSDTMVYVFALGIIFFSLGFVGMIKL